MGDVDFIVYTDGGCDVNPGGRGGYGVVIIDKKNDDILKFGEGYKATTNNRMEVTAIIKALDLLPNECSVILHSDSQYAINCASGLWKRNKNEDLWKMYDRISKGKNIYFEWVKGHNGDYYNEICDNLATISMGYENLLEDTGYVG